MRNKKRTSHVFCPPLLPLPTPLHPLIVQRSRGRRVCALRNRHHQDQLKSKGQSIDRRLPCRLSLLHSRGLWRGDSVTNKIIQNSLRKKGNRFPGTIVKPSAKKKPKQTIVPKIEYLNMDEYGSVPRWVYFNFLGHYLGAGRFVFFRLSIPPVMLSEHWPDPFLARENCGQSIGLTAVMYLHLPTCYYLSV